MTAINSLSVNATASPAGSGDDSWKLIAGSFVALQSVIGLVVLYAGVMNTKWVINSVFMSLYAFAMVLVCWVLWAYKLGFGDQMLPFVGYPRPVMTISDGLEPVAADVPQAAMVYYQFIFAAVATIIMAGAFFGRMNLAAWMLFVPLWLSFVYCVGAFSIWGGGFLSKLGIIDYAGGYVIHISSGASGFAGACIIFVLIGAGLIWTGWNGFSGGHSYAASANTGIAILNTNVCSAMSLLAWTLCDIVYFKKPSVLGAIDGMITGLIAISPAAGVVAPWSAVVIGALSGPITWGSIVFLRRKFINFHHIDDPLNMFYKHYVAAGLGGFLTGIFATEAACVTYRCVGAGGAVAGNGRQVWVQIVGITFIAGWSGAWTVLLLFLIFFVFRLPLRVSAEMMIIGDDGIHGESAYLTDEHLRRTSFYRNIHSVNHDDELRMDDELGFRNQIME